ncbi:MAG: carboxypeptidase regulatory-like domain-containing protein [Bacteroidota bacterium]
MNRYILFLVALMFFASGCRKDDSRSVRSFADFYEGDVLHSLASRNIESSQWIDFNNLDFVVSDDGSRYSLIQEGDQVSKGDIIWQYNNGVHQVNLVDEADPDNEIKFTFIRNDDYHIIAEVQWGQGHEVWLLVSGEDNIKGIVVDQEGISLPSTTVEISSNSTKIGEVIADDYGYFIFSQDMTGFEDLAGADRIVVCRDGYTDQRRVVDTGGQYFVTMTEGKSSLNHGMVYGYITNSITDKPLVGISVTVAYGSEIDVVTTNSQGYYEVLVPFSEESISVVTDGFEETDSFVSFDDSGRIQVNFPLNPTGSSVTGKVTDLNLSGVSGAEVVLKNKEGVIIDRYSSNPDGTFNFQSVFDGVYQMSISMPEYHFVPKYQMIAVSGKGISDVLFTGMADGKTGIGGRVFNQDDSSPVEGVTVICSNLSTKTDANGYYIMEIEEAGNHYITIEKEGYMTRCDKVSISENQLNYEDFSIAPPSSGVSSILYGYVYNNATNNPLDGAHVVENNGGEVFSDENGRYSTPIRVYNEEGAQYIKVTCNQENFISFSGFFSFRPFGNTPHNIYLEPL